MLEDFIATTIRPGRLTSETDTINGGAETRSVRQEHNRQPFQFSFHGLRPYQPSQSRRRSRILPLKNKQCQELFDRGAVAAHGVLQITVALAAE